MYNYIYFTLDTLFMHNSSSMEHLGKIILFLDSFGWLMYLLGLYVVKYDILVLCTVENLSQKENE